MTVDGHCNCGKVTVSLKQMPDASILCRCDNCRRSSGALHSSNLFLNKSDVEIKGEMKTFPYEAVSGATHERFFCPNCGSPIQTTDDNVPFTFVKTGLFPVGSVPSVRQVLFNKNKESWDTATYEGAEVKDVQ